MRKISINYRSTKFFKKLPLNKIFKNYHLTKISKKNYHSTNFFKKTQFAINLTAINLLGH